MFQKRSETPIEQRNYALFYLVFSGLLFLGTIWAVLDEVTIRRPWKEYQRAFYNLAAKKFEDQYREALAKIDSSKYNSLQTELASANADLLSKESLEAENTLDKLQMQLADATREWRFSRSRSDAAYYEYKKALFEGKDASKLEKKLDGFNAEIDKHAQEMDDLNKKIEEVQLVIKRYRGRVDSLIVEIKAMSADAEKWKNKSERMKASPIEVRQVVANDFEKTNFGELKARVDRCMTCHLGYNDINFEDASEPYKTHPLPELLKIHNPEKIGCTPCHRGQGPALTKGDAHGDADPYWEFPILRGKDVYAGCNSCHASETILKFAPRLVKAKQLLIESGCFGCHDIKGYNDFQKIGPELNDLAAKVKPEWIFRWIKNPKNYNPHTRMPNFKFTDEQAEAVTIYLMDVGKKSEFKSAFAKGFYQGGSAAKGKELVETIGCKGCHAIGNDLRMREARGTSYDIAPELTWVGGKVNPDWLFDWLKNPRHYHPTTRMPNLRLTDVEARDIVAYLTTLKDDRPQESKSLDLDNLEKIARGLKIIKEYGCFGCHDITGTEKEGKVSVDNSDFGRKKVEQMDFGDTKVPHTWADWVYNKLKNSRVFETDRIAQKMPVFAFTDEEIGMLRMLLVSFQREKPTDKYQYPVTKQLQQLEDGRRMTQWYNCIHCHNLEDRGGYILSMLENPGLGPPPLTGAGKKLQEPWLHYFLKAPTPIRPWIKIRMPTFGFTDEEITTISKYFLALGNQELELRDYAAIRPDPSLVPFGKRLFDEFKCIECHQLGGGASIDPSKLAPNLQLTRERLKPEWIVDWLRDPDAIQPGTQMPGYFPDLQSPDQTIFNGDAKKQMAAMRDYLLSIGRKK